MACATTGFPALSVAVRETPMDWNFARSRFFLFSGESGAVRSCLNVMGYVYMLSYVVIPFVRGRLYRIPLIVHTKATFTSYNITVRRRFTIRTDISVSFIAQSGAKPTCCSGRNARATIIEPATLKSSQWNHPINASTAISGVVLGIRSCHPKMASELMRTVVKLNMSLDPSKPGATSWPSATATAMSAAEPAKINANSTSTSSSSSRGRLICTVRMCQISSPRLTDSKASLLPSGTTLFNR
mmetsp:Transcript_11172/g.41403  ORF Transcript_11172/g.41403 Transcript_11172/m.41403 type:complete len:242 (+) Transcript_11172:292-1017(+)